MRGIADVEIEVPFTEIPELSKVPSLKPRAGQNMALHASLAAKHSASRLFVLLVHPFTFLPVFSQYKVTYSMNMHFVSA